MRGRFAGQTALIVALMAGVLGACGDDDGEASSDATAVGREASGGNTLEVEMVDYAYKVSGELGTGLATISSTNAGKEWHMAGFARLKEGKTVEELVAALQSGGEGEGGGATLRAGGQETTTTTAASGEGEGGGEEGGDPFAEFVEEEYGSPGHILQPGRGQSLTVDNLDAGSYVVLCFLPTEGEGMPHFTKGMVAGFDVADEAAGAEAPEADAEITLGDEAEPEGVPTDLGSGERTFEITSEGDAGKDFVMGQLDEGKQFDDFNTYFEGGFEAETGPPEGFAEQAPGTVLASTFEIESGQTIWVTVDVPKGETYFVGTTNIEGDEGEETVDKFVRVTVT